MRRPALLFLALLALLAAGTGPGLADARSVEKSRVQFAGFAGKVVNLFGGKAAREGVTTITSLKGDRRMSQTADHGELVSLSEEKVFTLDFKRQSYTVQTFEEIRRKFKEDMEKARREMAENRPAADAPQWDWDLDIEETGKKETISGYACRQVVLTVIAHEKGKKLEQSGGLILTADLWLGPRIKELEEIQAFELRYAQKLGLLELFQEQGMLAALAAYPALQEAMRKLEEKKVSLEGTPVRSIVSAESVPGPGAPEGAGAAEKPSLGGMLGKLGSQLSKKKGDAPGSGPQKAAIFSGTTDLLEVGSSVAAEAVTVPAGFKQR